MTKVKSTKNGLQAGTAGNAKKSLSGDSKTVIAVKDGNERTFSRLTWDFLPPDKNGWTLSSETPDEPITKKLNPVKDDNLSDDEQLLLDARTAYTNVFGTSPIETLTADELNEAVSVKIQAEQDEATKGLVEKVLTQDDLDLNADWAKAGKKVGETIFVNAEGAIVETQKPVVETPKVETPAKTKATEKSNVAKAEKVAKPKAQRKVVIKNQEGGK